MSDGDDQRPGARLTRRDFLQGVALGTGAALAPPALGAVRPELAGPLAPLQDLPGYYPPALTGLRGSHPGSFEAAHALRDGRPRPAAVDSAELYDLVVVGGGISGLAAAHLYRRQRPAARVLVLENHDDFGGHARRNEFELDGRLQLMNGGTLSIMSARPYSAVAEGLLRELGIDAAELVKRIVRPDFYAGLGLGRGIFLDRDTFGRDHLLKEAQGHGWARALAGAPLSERAQRQIVALEEGSVDYLARLAPAAKKDYLSTVSYRDYLVRDTGAGPEVARYYQQRTHDWAAVGSDAVSALDAWGLGMPGFAGLRLAPGGTARMGDTAAGLVATGGSVDLHFPDGGATVARALVRSLVPQALAGTGIDTLVTARANYAELDRPGAPVRIRLNATAVHAANMGADGAGGVRIEYLRAGRALAVHARHCVLACWNMMIPYLCPELPARQRQALAELVKAPLVYASVALRDWQAFARLGVEQIHAPGGYFAETELNEFGAIGDYRTATAPAQPTLVRMIRTPCAPGLTEHEQNRAGRAELLATPFATFEARIREQLTRMLGPGGFEADRDLLAITVNRWPHGYAPEYNPLFEPLLPEAERPQVIGRARRGAIAIANADSGAYAFIDGAIDQAERAVGELLRA